MTRSLLKCELDKELARIRLQQELVPCLGQLMTTAEVEFRPLPDAMSEIVQSSADFISIEPGAPATWLNIEADGANAALVIYRAGNGSHHVLAPRSKG